MAIDGNYNITIDSPMGKIEVKLALTATGTMSLTAPRTAPSAKNEFTGKVNGDEVSWDSVDRRPDG